jgi:NAD(P)-dependent dehydrogenase (short-subunit alcohol dehydrogenase family)
MAGSFDLSGKVAVVTGASRGLGQYMSRALARAGADVVITSRNIESLKTTQENLEAMGRRVLPCTLDTRRLETIQPMADQALATFGRIDILVNNAGCNIRKPAVDFTPEDWRTVVDTILTGAFFVAQAVARSAMIPQKWGRIINIGSTTCLFASPGSVAYCASRGGMTQMTKTLAAEWAQYGIAVNVIAPGWFRTGQTEARFHNPEWVASTEARIPAGRIATSTDLDGAVVFLASDASEYVTGQLLFVDGGYTLGTVRSISVASATAGR